MAKSEATKRIVQCVHNKSDTVVSRACEESKTRGKQQSLEAGSQIRASSSELQGIRWHTVFLITYARGAQDQVRS